MKKPATYEQLNALFAAGVKYYERGTLSRGTGRAKVYLFDYYKADRLTEEQRATLRQQCPLVEFFGSSPAYAPELRATLVAFPKAARMRELRAAKDNA